MKGDISRAARWTVVNGGMGAGLWFGLVEGLSGPLNIGLFLLWAQTIIAVLIFLDPRGRHSHMTRRRSVPNWIAEPYRVGMLGLLAWYGAWWSASAWAVTTVILIVFDRPPVRGEIVDI